MKILYFTDLHGSKWKYRKVSYLVRHYGCDIVINGGDMLPKTGNIHKKQKKFINRFLDRHFAWFDQNGIPYICMMGNDDLKAFHNDFTAVIGKYPYVHDIGLRTARIEKWYISGFNLVPDYPFGLKDWCRLDRCKDSISPQWGVPCYSTREGWQDIDEWERVARSLPTIEEELSNFCLQCHNRDWITVIHAPPYNSALDRLSDNTPAGSRAIREFIVKSRPYMSLHGHIHESPEVSGKWKQKLGETICMQPGQSVNFFTFVVIDIESHVITAMKKKLSCD